MSESDTAEYAAALGMEWLRKQQRWSGEYRGELVGLDGYYKSPVSYAKAGLQREGRRAMEWCVHNYMTKEGHFVATHGSADRHSDLYPDLWLVWGALRLGYTAVSELTLDFVMRHVESRTGGIRSRVGPNAEHRCADLRSTALGGLVALLAGHHDVAIKAARFVLELLELQPQVSRFFLAMEPNGQLVESYPAAHARFFVVSSEQKRPLLYAFGLAVAFLAKLFSVTRAPEYLSGAESYYFHAQEHGRPNAARHPYVGKLAWGASMLYRETGEPAYRIFVSEVVGYILSLQVPSGAWWVKDNYGEFALQPRELTLDRTAEFALWLTSIARDLASRSDTNASPDQR